jgi:hypothetical protein
MNKSILVKSKYAWIWELWEKYFPDVTLNKSFWFEHSKPSLFQEALIIASEKDKQGRFRTRTQDDIGPYVNAVIRNLKEKHRSSTTVMQLDITVEAYKITDKDKQRFKKKLVPAGDCLLFGKLNNKKDYKRFHVNGRLVGAHVFAFYADQGHLPDSGHLRGLEIAHSCGTPNCCNKEHLKLASKAVNLAERKYHTSSMSQENIEVKCTDAQQSTAPSSIEPNPVSSFDLFRLEIPCPL